MQVYRTRSVPDLSLYSRYTPKWPYRYYRDWDLVIRLICVLLTSLFPKVSIDSDSFPITCFFILFLDGMELMFDFSVYPTRIFAYSSSSLKSNGCSTMIIGTIATTTTVRYIAVHSFPVVTTIITTLWIHIVSGTIHTAIGLATEDTCMFPMVVSKMVKIIPQNWFLPSFSSNSTSKYLDYFYNVENCAFSDTIIRRTTVDIIIIMTIIHAIVTLITIRIVTVITHRLTATGCRPLIGIDVLGWVLPNI